MSRSLPSFSLSIPGCLLSIVSCLALHYLSSFIVVSAHVSPSSFTLYISLWSCWFVQHVSLLLHFYFTRSVFYLPVKSRTSTSHQMFWCASLFTCHQTRFLTRCLSCNRVSRSVKPTHGWQISSIDACRQKYDKYKMFLHCRLYQTKAAWLQSPGKTRPLKQKPVRWGNARM